MKQEIVSKRGIYIIVQELVGSGQERLAGHFGRLVQSHDGQDGGSDVCQARVVSNL